MTDVFKRIASVTAAVLFALLAVFPVAAKTDGADPATLYEGVVGYFRNKYSAADTNTLIGDGSAEWVYLSLRSGGETAGVNKFAAALSGLEFSGSPVERQRIALTMIASGMDSEALAIAEETVGKLGIMSNIFGLIIFDSLGSDLYSGPLDALLEAQLPKGGWALYGEKFDFDVTAMTITALSKHKDHPGVSEAIEKGFDLISSRQEPTGDFSSWGVRNPESGCQVIIALCACGIDPLADERFIKNGNTLLDGLALYLRDDGGFSHTLDGKTNTNSSYQALQALTALKVFPDRGFYDFPPVDSQPVNPVESADPLPEDGSSYADTSEFSQPSPESGRDAETGFPVRKAIIALAIVAVGASAVVVLAVTKKGGKRVIAVVAVFTFAVAAASLALDIKTPQEYSDSVEVSADFDYFVSFTLDYGESAGGFAGTYSVGVVKGDTVLDVLRRFSAERGIKVDLRGSYVRGIDGVYEFDLSPSSGWMYEVNGEYPMATAVDYLVKENDVIVWRYVS